jgi:methanogenic corrinoid protein MtbC1
MVKVDELLKEEGLRDRVFTMIGGIAMGPEWAPKVGADVYTRDAYEAAETAKAHMAEIKAGK